MSGVARDVGVPGARATSTGARARFQRPALFAVDLALVPATLAAAFVLRFGVPQTPETWNAVAICCVAMTAISAIVFPLLRLYEKQWRYASIDDLVAVCTAVAVSSAIFLAAMALDARMAFAPPTVVALQALLAVTALGAVRLLLRLNDVNWLLHRLPAPLSRGVAVDDRAPVLLVGAGDSGALYLRALAREEAASYRPVGFLDDDDEPGSTLRGVPILGPLDRFADVIGHLDGQGDRPRHVIVTRAPGDLGPDASRALIDEADRLGLPVSCVSSPTELRGAEDAPTLRRIELADILQRPQTALDREAVGAFVRGRTVAVTGAGGSIGAELVRQIAAFGPLHIVLVDNCEYNLYAIHRELGERFDHVARTPCLCDIRSRARIEAVFEAHRPDLVFHAAALKHVPMVELNPCEGVLTNVQGTRNVAEAARAVAADAFVQVSTDKAVDSTSVMGATKRVGELFCQALDLVPRDPRPGAADPSARATRFMTVRFGNVLGSSGSLIPLFQEQLARGGPLTVTDAQMTRYFMTIREAVELTLHASALGRSGGVGRGEIFVLDMGEPVRIMDIATRMIRLAGKTSGEIDIEIVGCRPGEKLFEELFDSAETRVECPIPGIMGARPTPLPLRRLSRNMDTLVESAMQGDVEGVYRGLQRMMPRYRPQRRLDDGWQAKPALRAPALAPGQAGANATRTLVEEIAR